MNLVLLLYLCLGISVTAFKLFVFYACSIELDGLRPGTEYTAKISIYSDYTNRVLGQSTEEIAFSTLPVLAVYCPTSLTFCTAGLPP